MSLTVEIPTMIIDSGAIGVSVVIIGGAFASVVVMIDYAFDRVKESAYKLLVGELERKK